MLLVDWIQKITIGARTDEENSVRVTIEDTATAQTKSEVDATRECHEEEIIAQLKKMNQYLSIVVGCKL